MKQLKIFSILPVLCLLISLLSPAAAAAEPPAVTSATVYMADPDTGYVYYDKGGSERVYPASLTKIMTALLIVEAVEQGEISLDDPVTAQEGFDADMIEGGSNVGITVGETMTLRELLYCTLLSSANEAANVMAMYLCGDVASFVALMNARAAELGCVDTHFVNPHGLPHDDHYTTAYDMYLIAREAMNHHLFATVCGTELYVVPETNKFEERTLVNTNGLITTAGKYKNIYYYAPAVGIKTGHTKQAGYCLASQAVKNQISPICIVMGGSAVKLSKTVTGSTTFPDSVTLYNWVFSNYTRMKLMDGETIVTEIPVRLSSDGDMVKLRPREDITGVLPNGSDLSLLETDFVIYSEDVTAPLSEGQVLGEVSLSMEGIVYGTAYLVADRDMDLSPVASMLDRVGITLSNPIVLLVIVVLAVLAVLYAVSVIRYRAKFRREQRALEQARLQRQKLQEQAERERLMGSAKRRVQRNLAQKQGTLDQSREHFEQYFDDENH